MQQTAKHFADELNKSLDELGTPTQIRERALILSKMINIPKQQAWGFLEGLMVPDNETLKMMATELELDITPFLHDQQSK